MVCIGGGPSLTSDDVAFCRGRAHVVAINDAYRLAPWADLVYACDPSWWKWHKGVPKYRGMKFGLEAPDGPEFPSDVRLLQNTGERGLEVSRWGVRTGCNSGYQAINVAVHLGASRIVLLGYDMQALRDGPSHWFGEHPNKIRSPYLKFLSTFPSLLEPLKQRNVSVMNATRETALECFPRVSLVEALA